MLGNQICSYLTAVRAAGKRGQVLLVLATPSLAWRETLCSGHNFADNARGERGHGRDEAALAGG